MITNRQEYNIEILEILKQLVYDYPDIRSCQLLNVTNIVKDESVRERYMTENGTLDVDLAVESAKVMYGFLETLNTIQIEKVDEKYIANIINGMK